jgi:predicted Zn-ribbon and HTH transcriptional regulator
MDLELPPDRVKGKNYKCRECGERFTSVSKRPVCPSCQSEDVEEA